MGKVKLSSILENENKRESVEDFTKIYLYEEGKFYRAFNESAFLIKTVVCTEDFQRQRGDRSILQSPRYQTPNNDYVVVGFPLESFSKYILRYDDVKKMEEDGYLVITIDKTLFGDGVSAEDIRAAYDQWFAACPIKDRAKSRTEVTSGAGIQSELGRSGLFSIVSEILGYAIENSTPAQNVEFISNIKQKLLKLL